MVASPVRRRPGSSVSPIVQAGLSLADALRRRAEAGRAERNYPETVYDWAKLYRKIEGQEFSLERHLPLVPIYKDNHPVKTLVKPAQRGLSEYAICFTCYALDVGADAWAPQKMGLNVGYILPTMGALRDFSKERLSALEDEDPHLAEMFQSGKYQDVMFKQIRGASYLYLRGGWSTEGLKTFPADAMVVDEYDEMNVRALPLVDKRMNASPVKRKLELSTPILPGMGIHGRFMQSDQRVYIQQCPNCRADNHYDFFRDVLVDGQRYEDWRYTPVEIIARADVALSCPACGILLDKAARTSPGVYVAQNPEVTTLRGYHIPALPYPDVSVKDLAMRAVTADVTAFEEFMRQDLGVPYHATGSGITEEMIVQMSVDLPNGQLPPGPWKNVCMGIDVGARFHVRINGEKDGEDKPYCLYMGSVTSWQEVDDLMERFRVRMAVVDSMPDLHGSAAFVSRHKGRAVQADYPGRMNALKGQLFAPDSKKAVQDGFVRINRTMALDRVYTVVAAASEHWPTSVSENPEVREHFTGMARVTSVDKSGQVVSAWIRIKPDHFFHASAYAAVARQLAPKRRRSGHVAQGTVRSPMPSGTNYRPPNPATLNG